MTRTDPPLTGDERNLLTAFLDHQRQTVVAKARGLSPDQAHAPHPPSALTLAGLVKHLAYVEDSWLQETFAGRGLPEPWASAPFAQDRDWELSSARYDDLEDLVACTARLPPAATPSSPPPTSTTWRPSR
jgi:uncharacterized damage-inducible protein DinB